MSNTYDASPGAAHIFSYGGNDIKIYYFDRKVQGLIDSQHHLSYRLKNSYTLRFPAVDTALYDVELAIRNKIYELLQHE